MKRIITALALAAAALGAQAAETDKAVDASVGLVLKQLDYPYEIDEDGDYKLVFDAGDERSQLVFVRSTVEEFGSLKIREVWSPGYTAPGKQFPAAVANRLLEDSQDAKLGGWVKQQQMAMFVVKVDADASAEHLSDAIDAAMRTADAMEKELTGTDEY